MKKDNNLKAGVFDAPLPPLSKRHLYDEVELEARERYLNERLISKYYDYCVEFIRNETRRLQGINCPES